MPDPTSLQRAHIVRCIDHLVHDIEAFQRERWPLPDRVDLEKFIPRFLDQIELLYRNLKDVGFNADAVFLCERHKKLVGAVYGLHLFEELSPEDLELARADPESVPIPGDEAEWREQLRGIIGGCGWVRKLLKRLRPTFDAPELSQSPANSPQTQTSGVKRKRGRPPHDPIADDRLIEAWRASGLTKAEFEGERGRPQNTIQQAMDRKRNRRQ